ncbi:methylenetetrahydrofolate reductase [NAD(P)H] [Nocardioides massiliensis]|uniref:Methylenetetrahydrofolate reductase n=1 Tax=Nocardioides massiliensis TaxID=1325935 RepID=A0ABT9NTL3_9ACTN|nr:methylenetetrahydrofolate reductase [NAD(P)H] [Nocardioides massiliensis]MDP9823529.1 methylenetetrahydrofolate reductase (NADPH) [Nocardioides massiliensis]
MALGLPSRMPCGHAIVDLLAAGERSFSFEFFPPKDADGERALWRAIRELEPLRPTFVSVTEGAGGSTRDGTVGITERIAAETTLTPMAHLTCVGQTVEELRHVIGRYADAGVRNVLALRGDPPTGPGTAWVPTEGGLNYASELVALARSLGDFSVGVAVFPLGHRDCATLEADVDAMRAKADAGAQFGITEMFFRAEDYFGLRERCDRAGIDIPLLPGIMPILSARSIVRMAELSGREVPAEVVQRFDGVDDPADVRRIGVEIATELCDELLAGGAPGLHFFTLNRSRATREIYEGLGVHA